MHYLLAIAPQKSPLLWFRVNSTLFVWSVLLLIELLFTEAPLERLEGTRAYLAWNFVTTLVWFGEVGLKCYYINDSIIRDGWTQLHQIIFLQTRQDIETFVELMLAIYYLIDSAKVFRSWHKADIDLSGELFDAILNSLSYLYEMSTFRRLPEPNNYNDISDHPPIGSPSIALSDNSISSSLVVGV